VAQADDRGATTHQHPCVSSWEIRHRRGSDFRTWHNSVFSAVLLAYRRFLFVRILSPVAYHLPIFGGTLRTSRGSSCTTPHRARDVGGLSSLDDGAAAGRQTTLWLRNVGSQPVNRVVTSETKYRRINENLVQKKIHIGDTTSPSTRGKTTTTYARKDRKPIVHSTGSATQTRPGTNQYLTFIAYRSHSSPNLFLICSSSATALVYPTPAV